MPCEDTDTLGSVKWCTCRPRNTKTDRRHQKWEDASMGSLPQEPEATWPCWHCVSLDTHSLIFTFIYKLCLYKTLYSYFIQKQLPIANECFLFYMLMDCLVSSRIQTTTEREQELPNYDPCAKSGPPPIVVNEGSLELSPNSFKSQFPHLWNKDNNLLHKIIVTA